MKNQATRREFLQVAGATGAGFWLTAGQQRQARADTNSRIAFGGIGIGGKGDSDIINASKFCDVVAVCDTDRNRMKHAMERFPNSKGFTDYREMLDSLGDKIDAVTVSTADHTHACASLMAMRMKKHCYVQKPLTRTIYEARLMGKVAKEMGVCTQMGNQGSSERGLRTAAAQLRAGALGDVLEMHVWTDRPAGWWPQGIDPNRVKTLAEFSEKAKKEQSSEDAERLIREMDERIQDNLKNHIDWEAWIGPVKFREFFPSVYTPFVWRGWWDFGTGALGDIACHSLNMPMKGLDLSAPTEVVATTSGHDFDIFPLWSIIDFTYKANSWRPGFKFTWYDGGKRPAPEILQKYGIALDAGGGSIIIGTKGAMIGNRVVGTESIRGLEVEFAPEHAEHNDGDSRNMYELCVAIQEGKPERCFSNFPNQAGPLTEAMLLGNLAVWTAYEAEKQGETVKWDAANMNVTNLADIKTPGTADLIKPVYRDGYRLD